MSLPAPDPSTTVLVTGASSGIGEALARELARRGYGVSIVARRRKRLSALAGELREHGVEVSTHQADLARDADRARVLRDVRAERRVVGVCNNAGTGVFGRVADHDPDDEAQVFRTNALALHDLTTHLVHDLVEAGEGAILNVASVLAFAPMPQNATYAATKAFVQSFSEALHAELSGTGVSCTTVSPGATRTEIFEVAGAGGVTGVGGGLLWQDASDVADAAVDAMIAGRRTVIPGWQNKLAVLGYRFTPRTALLPAARVAQSEPVRRFFGADGNGH